MGAKMKHWSTPNGCRESCPACAKEQAEAEGREIIIPTNLQLVLEYVIEREYEDYAEFCAENELDRDPIGIDHMMHVYAKAVVEMEKMGIETGHVFDSEVME